MTLDALFASGATQAPAEGSLIPLEEMPLGAFKEMVERHLGRELTDDTGRDLAAWLESTMPGGEGTAEASAAMAHLLVGMAREEAAEAPAAPQVPADVEAAATPTTLGARLSALARTIGLPIGRRDDAGPPQPLVNEARSAHTVEQSAHAVEQSVATETEQVAVRRPVMKPPLSKAQREAVLAAASSPAPLVIDLRGEDPFELAALGGGKPSPTGTAPSLTSSTGLGADPISGAHPISGADPIPTVAVATPESADLPADMGLLEERMQGIATPRDSTAEPGVRLDLAQVATARSGASDAQPGARAQAAPPAAPSVVPPMAVERIMRIVELQATAPPPRMAVVEIPEMDGLRIMVSLTDRGAVSVTALGALTESVQAPFMQSVATALETQGFLLDERSRGRSEEHRQNPDRGRPDRDQPRRRPRPDGLFA